MTRKSSSDGSGSGEGPRQPPPPRLGYGRLGWERPGLSRLRRDRGERPSRQAGAVSMLSLCVSIPCSRAGEPAPVSLSSASESPQFEYDFGHGFGGPMRACCRRMERLGYGGRCYYILMRDRCILYIYVCNMARPGQRDEATRTRDSQYLSITYNTPQIRGPGP